MRRITLVLAACFGFVGCWDTCYSLCSEGDCQAFLANADAGTDQVASCENSCQQEVDDPDVNADAAGFCESAVSRAVICSPRDACETGDGCSYNSSAAIADCIDDTNYLMERLLLEGVSHAEKYQDLVLADYSDEEDVVAPVKQSVRDCELRSLDPACQTTAQ